MTSYAQAVPAVTRALHVLDRLALAPRGLTLSELARQLHIQPSSLLAILNTLRGRGYVVRREPGKRYELGQALRGLAGAGAGGIDLQRELGEVAEALAAKTGETVLLWLLEGQDVVLSASREGSHALRFVPQPRMRRPAGASAAGRVLLAGLSHPAPVASLGRGRRRLSDVRQSGYAAVDPEPGLRTLAAPVLDHEERVFAALEVAGPSQRLEEALTALVEAAGELSLRLGCREYRPYRRESQAVPSGLSAEELDAFLSGARLARLACVQADGYPYVVPVWYEWDGRGFWIVPRGRARWAASLRHNPRVSMSIDEAEPPMRRVIVEGRAELIEEPGGDGRAVEVMRRLVRRYLGQAGDLYLERMAREPHWLFRVHAERLTTWRGLAPHPRYLEAAGEGVA